MAQKKYQRDWYRRKKHDPKFLAERKKRRRDYEDTLAGAVRCRLSGIRNEARRKGYPPVTSSPEEIIDAYTGRCFLCKVKAELTSRGSMKGLCIDHCHRTGKFRGWLCHDCNVALGLFKDKPRLIRKAAEYVENNHD